MHDLKAFPVAQMSDSLHFEHCSCLVDFFDIELPLLALACYSRNWLDFVSEIFHDKFTTTPGAHHFEQHAASFAVTNEGKRTTFFAVLFQRTVIVCIVDNNARKIANFPVFETPLTITIVFAMPVDP